MNPQVMIQRALTSWRNMNRNPNKWATFEAATFPDTIRCAVEWGYRHSDGTKEMAIQTIIWTYNNSLGYSTVKLTHN